MSFFGKIFRKSFRFVKKPILRPLWMILFDKARREVERLAEDPADELRLTVAGGIGRTGETVDLTLTSEFHRAVLGSGHVQYRRADSSVFLDIEMDDTWDGPSPFPYTSQQSVQTIPVVPNSPGNFFLRIKIVENPESVFFTNDVRKKILGVGGGVIE